MDFGPEFWGPFWGPDLRGGFWCTALSSLGGIPFHRDRFMVILGIHAGGFVRVVADLWVRPNRAFVIFINSGFYSDFGGPPPGHLGDQLGGSWVPAGPQARWRDCGFWGDLGGVGWIGGRGRFGATISTDLAWFQLGAGLGFWGDFR